MWIDCRVLLVKFSVPLLVKTGGIHVQEAAHLSHDAYMGCSVVLLVSGVRLSAAEDQSTRVPMRESNKRMDHRKIAAGHALGVGENILTYFRIRQR